MDAVLLTRKAYSFAELSLSPVFRRKWCSLYEALDDCSPNRRKLSKFYLQEIPKNKRIILAGDRTPWPRTEAPTLKDRTYEHGAKVISGKPITLGHGYSTLTWIREEKGSWALPLLNERITSFETPITRAIFQLKQVCKQLEIRTITLWYSEYGNAKFINLTADINADLLIRIRPIAVFLESLKTTKKTKWEDPKYTVMLGASLLGGNLRAGAPQNEII